MYEIIIGRTEEDKKRFGDQGMLHIGKHYVKMGQTNSLSNNVFLDAARPHVVFICGKRGSGKSYSQAVIAEGLATLPSEISQNLSVLMLDTMGVYWTMKYENKKDAAALKEWKLKPEQFNIKLYVPTGFYDEFKNKGIPVDFPFSIRPSELDPLDWCTIFNIAITDSIGVLIERIVLELKDQRKNFSISDISKAIRADKKTVQDVRDAAENRFNNAEFWGLFNEKGTDFAELASPGQVSVLDISCYATEAYGSGIKALVIGLVAEKLFVQRMIYRKKEEFDELKQSEELWQKTKPKEMPLVWIMIDEAHEFLPRRGETSATKPLLTLLREGRQPGIALVLASQQPGQIHTDVITQSDVVISHRLTAKIDIDALGLLMQSYMREGLDKAISDLPREDGAALVFDDTNERIYPIKVRPRFTWHGGSAPTPIQKEKSNFLI